MTNKHRHPHALALALLLTISCTPRGGGSNPEPDVTPAPTDFADFPIEENWSNGGGGDGDGANPAPSICAWAKSSDVIIWGMLEEIRFIDSPATYQSTPGGGWAWKEGACESPVFPAIDLAVRVTHVVQGDASWVGELVPARMGPANYASYHPWPLEGEEGEVTWFQHESEPATPQWGPGKRIGLVLRDVPEHNLLSVMGEAFFLPHVEGGIAFLSHNRASEAGPPVDANGLEIDALIDQVAVCNGSESDEADLRRQRYWNSWGPGTNGSGDPLNYMAARCSDQGFDPCAESGGDDENGDADGDGDGDCEG